MRVVITITIALLVGSSVDGADYKVHRDLPYTESKNDRRKLDVYAPAQGKDHPILVWIHGGGWRRGDKAGVQRKRVCSCGSSSRSTYKKNSGTVNSCRRGVTRR